jgi:hypothetical protein
VAHHYIDFIYFFVLSGWPAGPTTPLKTDCADPKYNGLSACHPIVQVAIGLSKALADPVASLIALPLQHKFEQKGAPGGEGARHVLNIQPVISLPTPAMTGGFAMTFPGPLSSPSPPTARRGAGAAR